MEVLKWSKAELAEEFRDCNKLSQLILAIENRLMRSQKVVCKVIVNGMLLTDQDEKRFADTTLEGIDSLEVAFRESETLLSETVDSLVEWIDRLKQSVIETAERYRVEGPNVNAYVFSRVIANTHWLTDALQVIQRNMPELVGWRECEEKLMSALQELETAYRHCDYVLIADVLEYELSESLDQWRDLLLKGAESRVR